VCATQNPIEYEGTYPLPEAQLDRFLVKLEASYPHEQAELQLLARVADGFDARSIEPEKIAPVVQPAEIVQAQEQVRTVHVSAAVQRYVYAIVAATRAHRQLSLGASPRAGVSMLLATQAAAAIDARAFATPDDVKAVAPLVLPHRLIVQPQAEIEGVRAASIIEEILQSAPVPREAAD
jgi:MoxR-like ATPase